MCGIVYGRTLEKDPINASIVKQFNIQRNRGTSGFGFFLPEFNKLVHNTKEYRILSLLRRQPAKEILFHHRQPTSTDNLRRSCHPFSTKDVFKHNYVVVHNGHIGNAAEMKAIHEKELGIKYVSTVADGKFNDTEALVWELGLILDGRIKESRLRGWAAFVAVEMDGDKPVAVHFGTDSTILRYGYTDKGFAVASLLEGGQGCDSDVLYTYTHATHKITKRPLIMTASNWGRRVRTTPTTTPRAKIAFGEKPETELSELEDLEWDATDESLSHKKKREILKKTYANIPKYTKVASKASVYDSELVRITADGASPRIIAFRARGDVLLMNNALKVIKLLGLEHRERRKVKFIQRRISELGHIRKAAENNKIPMAQQVIHRLLQAQNEEKSSPS